MEKLPQEKEKLNDDKLVDWKTGNASSPVIQSTSPPPAQPPGEINGPKGPEPTRYGDWEVGGRCSDF
jgi:hypothetical protein